MKDRAQRTPDPTPEEIAERAAAIRKANEATRKGFSEREPYAPRVVSTRAIEEAEEE